MFYIWALPGQQSQSEYVQCHHGILSAARTKSRFDIAQSLGVAAPNALIKLVAGSGRTWPTCWTGQPGQRQSGSAGVFFSWMATPMWCWTPTRQSDVFGDTDTGITPDGPGGCTVVGFCLRGGGLMRNGLH